MYLGSIHGLSSNPYQTWIAGCGTSPLIHLGRYLPRPSREIEAFLSKGTASAMKTWLEIQTGLEGCAFQKVEILLWTGRHRRWGVAGLDDGLLAAAERETAALQKLQGREMALGPRPNGRMAGVGRAWPWSGLSPAPPHQPAAPAWRKRGILPRGLGMG